MNNEKFIVKIGSNLDETSDVKKLPRKTVNDVATEIHDCITAVGDILGIKIDDFGISGNPKELVAFNFRAAGDPPRQFMGYLKPVRRLKNKRSK